LTGPLAQIWLGILCSLCYLINISSNALTQALTSLILSGAYPDKINVNTEFQLSSNSNAHQKFPKDIVTIK
jgi:hypothetical protein